MSNSRESDRDAFEKWYAEHGQLLVTEVRRKLFERARVALAITSNDIAHSVLVSFVAKHHAMVDWNDPRSVNYLMVGAAWRHAVKHNKRATRRDALNKQGQSMMGVSRDYEVTSDDNETRVDPVDFRERTKQLFYQDCVAAFRMLGVDTSLAESAGDVLSMDPNGAVLCHSLTPLEAHVVACKIACMNIQQIVELLNQEHLDMSVNKVHTAWQSVLRKGARLNEADDQADDKADD